MLVSTKFKVNQHTGLLEQAIYRSSPHCDDRPLGGAVDLVVIHGISLPPGKFGSDDILQFFLGRLDQGRDPYFQEIAHLRVSSHFLIKRTGELIQFVPLHKRAWHAGESSFRGRTQCNDFSIGIELEGTDALPYEHVQYEVLAEVIRALRVAYPAITLDRITGHSDIAPGRKTDPGPMFDWDDLKGKLL